MAINFDASREEYDLAAQIVVRACSLLADIDRIALEMDIIATHMNGCPLDLPKLLAARDFDFVHDVVGIIEHIDRSTGELRDCFLPRCALPETARR